MGKFVPDSFKPRESDIDWAMDKFKITRDEVDNQLEEFIDHEFKRSYTDWNRCFRNWFRNADKYQLLTRERVYGSNTPDLEAEDTEAEKIKYADNLERLQKMALRVVK